MMERPKTIQIFLPTGDPQGIRTAEMTTRIVRVIEVPRSLLKQFLTMPESDQVALYFLVSRGEEEAQPMVYVGQSSDLRNRLAEHNRQKEFWERVLVLVSLTNNLTQTHACFLEWYCLKEVRTAGRFEDQNGNAAARPFTPPSLEADCMEVFDTGKVLLATLGFPVFDPIVQSSERAVDDVYYCKSSGIDGRGLYTTEGFVVLKDSIGRLANVASISGTSDERFRQQLISSGSMVPDGETVVFAKDHVFGSPSMAAVALLGRTANGWLEWKRVDGKTLDEVVRQQPATGA